MFNLRVKRELSYKIDLKDLGGIMLSRIGMGLATTFGAGKALTEFSNRVSESRVDLLTSTEQVKFKLVDKHISKPFAELAARVDDMTDSAAREAFNDIMVNARNVRGLNTPMCRVVLAANPIAHTLFPGSAKTAIPCIARWFEGDGGKAFMVSDRTSDVFFSQFGSRGESAEHDKRMWDYDGLGMAAAGGPRGVRGLFAMMALSAVDVGGWNPSDHYQL